MTTQRCIRCNGSKKASYMGGMYTTCLVCNGIGYVTIDKPINVIDYDAFIDNGKELFKGAIIINEPDNNHPKVDITKSIAKRLEIQASDKIDKRSKAYRDSKLKEALENG